MDVGIQFPQSKNYESAADIRSLVKKAAILDTSKTDIRLVSSMSVEDGKQGGPETLFALAIERFDVRLKLGGMQFAEFNIALGVLRSGSADPLYEPERYVCKGQPGFFLPF